MKQVLQDLKSGASILADVPIPRVSTGHVLVKTVRTLVSAGTERMLVDFGRANLFDKARQQPEKVRMVLDKIRTDGLMPTIEAVRNKLDQPLPMGYSNVGRVAELGKGVDRYTIGDRVVSNGWHAEYVNAPLNLSARVPDNVSDDQAAFTVVSAIGLQGVRLSQPTLGEHFVVTGLGLIGLITVQLLRAHGCKVLGIDFDPARLELARQFGAETVDLSAGQDPVAVAGAWTGGRGVDGVLITAATQSNEPMHQAALMCRKRGRIVLVGITGLELSRADFYEKELSFQVSCSYGPGRYDPSYEQQGNDYPLAYVRWTEQRNFEAVLDMLADGRLDVDPLISHRFAIADAANAYDVVAGSEPSLAILMEFPNGEIDAPAQGRSISLALAKGRKGGQAPKLSFIGAGNYASAVLVPAFKKANAEFQTIACSAGVTGHYTGKKHGFKSLTTDSSTIFEDKATNVVVVATRHDSHAEYVCQAIAAGLHVFVEKPLCLRRDELAAIEVAAESNSGSTLIMVGFNRRFAPNVVRMRELLAGVPGPKSLSMMVNAGEIPAEHWAQDHATGGGRILGEACHFVDLLRHVVGSRINHHSISYMKSDCSDTACIQLGFEDGSVGSIQYFANGSKAFPKERLEVFAGGRILQLDNFRRLRGFGWPGFSSQSLFRQDKGQNACAQAFLEAVRSGGPSPIPFDEIVEVARVSMELAGVTE